MCLMLDKTDSWINGQSLCLCSGEVKQEGGSVFREGAPYQRRGSLQLWQFLVALLDDPGNAHFIAWTGRGMEFKLIEPEEVSIRLLRVLSRQNMIFIQKSK